MGFSKKRERRYRKQVKKFLGMDKGTAMHRLKKTIMFELVKKAGMDRCYRCRLLITNVSELSVEHMKSWLWKDVKLFWDINNIAFSHLACNVRASNFKQKCGSYSKYLKGCRCDICETKYRIRTKEQYSRYYKKFAMIKRLANLHTNKEVRPYIKKMRNKYGFTKLNQLIDKLKKEKR